MFHVRPIDINLLSQLYNLLQDLTLEHKNMDHTLRAVIIQDCATASDFDKIEIASAAIVDICSKMKNCLKEKDCCHI